jgi:mRNA interferase MazF
MNYAKRFFEWIKLKEKLHSKEHAPPLFKEGEIWWSHFGENVGTEMNGKSDLFTRPVVILKKYDRYSFLAVPLSTKHKEGTWYVTFTHGQKRQTAVLSQARVINYRRLKELMGKLDGNDYQDIKKAFLKLHK